jgi:hypothetical protein
MVLLSILLNCALLFLLCGFDAYVLGTGGVYKGLAEIVPYDKASQLVQTQESGLCKAQPHRLGAQHSASKLQQQLPGLW